MSDICIISNEVFSVASWKPKVDYQTVLETRIFLRMKGVLLITMLGHRYKLELPLRQLIKRMQRDLPY